MDSSQKAIILLTVPLVQLCQIQDDVTELVEQTELNLASMPDKQVILNIGSHCMPLTKMIPIYLTAYEKSRSYLYSNLGNIYSIIIQEAGNQQYFDALDRIFDQNAMLVVKDMEGSQFQNGGGKALSAPAAQKSSWQTLSDGVSSLGSSVSKGLISGGVMLTDGIVQLGSYLESKIVPSEPVQISENTKQNVQLVKDVSGKALEVTSQMAAKIIEMNVQLANMMADTVVQVAGIKKDQTEKPPNPDLVKAKEFGKNSIAVTLGVLDSLDQAAEKVGKIKALGQTMKKLVEKKYGKEASEVFSTGVDAVGNIGTSYKDLKKAEVTAIAKATAKETAKQVSDKI